MVAVPGTLATAVELIVHHGFLQNRSGSVIRVQKDQEYSNYKKLRMHGVKSQFNVWLQSCYPLRNSIPPEGKNGRARKKRTDTTNPWISPAMALLR